MNYICNMRFLKSILLVVYILSAAGINVRLHYCCGQLADVHWGTIDNNGKGCESHNCCKAHKDCCRYEDITLANSEDHCAPQIITLSGEFKTEEHQDRTYSAAPSILVQTIYHVSKELPPLLRKKTYIVFCQRKSCDHLV
ncbi:MAG: HYC_CC_PP family protein [Flavobacteriales bacterium]